MIYIYIIYTIVCASTSLFAVAVCSSRISRSGARSAERICLMRWRTSRKAGRSSLGKDLEGERIYTYIYIQAIYISCICIYICGFIYTSMCIYMLLYIHLVLSSDILWHQKCWVFTQLQVGP